MKNFLSFVSFFLALAVGAVNADDESDVQAVVDAVIAASNANDLDKEERYYSSEATEFNGWGSELRKLDWDGARDWVKKGGKWKVEHGKIDIAMHGTAAIVTGYAKGKFSPPDKGWMEWLGRYTWVLSKEDGAWKIVHRHNSRGIFVPADEDK